VRVYGLRGQAVPPGWVLDGAGNPVEDPSLATDTIFKHKEGGLTPLGGVEAMASYKGYGLAMMVHVLGGALSGASFSPIRNRTQKPGDPDDLGHFFMAIDPDAFRADGGFEADMEDVIDVLHATPPADPALPVLVPGDPEAAKRKERLRDGIPVPPALVESLRDVCERCGAPFLLMG
jgi:LDH2 family malate/lactate/ureidoglycolate dehydrogenase